MWKIKENRIKKGINGNGRPRLSMHIRESIGYERGKIQQITECGKKIIVELGIILD
jgi:hypothetical protein